MPENLSKHQYRRLLSRGKGQSIVRYVFILDYAQIYAICMGSERAIILITNRRFLTRKGKGGQIGQRDIQIIIKTP